MRLSYPNIEDARRGLATRLISTEDYWQIVRRIRVGGKPPQHTKLGGSIRIHGGGSTRDWTLGCVALEDTDVADLFSRVRAGTRVEIYRSQKHADAMRRKDYLGQRVLAGARQQLQKPARYTRRAMGLQPLRYPLGDIDPASAVCTDIAIRAMRHAGLDLQALVHEDVRIHPERYRQLIKKPNANIDHRRTRNVVRYLQRYASRLSLDADYRAGDIAIILRLRRTPRGSR